MTTDVQHVAQLRPDLAPPPISLPRSHEEGAVRFRWWMPSIAVFAVLAGLFFYCATSDAGAGWFEVRSTGWWVLTTALNLPFFVALFFLLGGLVERIGFYWRGRAPEPAGRLPAVYPTVCVQLPMFNEHAVAKRVIEAASKMTWPADRFSVQVLDDSTDEDTRALVEDVCSRVRESTGVNCYVRHRVVRQGYKAGALEEGRKKTDAEFLAIFDADFVPPKDFLLRTIPHFYLPSGEPDAGLALVQAQWGHLNHDESLLTLAQSLWVDDHHTLQMSWRSAMWRFVNFTGTAGVWRASAIQAAGGWRAASLVEDCELSFRHLFAGYRTKFVKEIVAPAELPATYTAYKAQQRRWTQGWVQLQRLHLATLLFRFRCSWLRRIHFLYHMCISWQWPAWAFWVTTLPFMVYTDHWFGSLGFGVGVSLYMLPTALWAVAVATMASLETKHTYHRSITPATFRERLRAYRPVPRHQHRNAPASVQLLRRGSLRSPAQRVRAHSKGSLRHHKVHHGRTRRTPQNGGGPRSGRWPNRAAVHGCGADTDYQEVLQRQGSLALRFDGGILCCISAWLGGALCRKRSRVVHLRRCLRGFLHRLSRLLLRRPPWQGLLRLRPESVPWPPAVNSSGRHAGEIRVELREQANGHHALSICDHGSGLPPGLRIEETGSLGLRLVRTLTQHLGGKLVVSSNGGARFEIVFPAQLTS